LSLFIRRVQEQTFDMVQFVTWSNQQGIAWKPAEDTEHFKSVFFLVQVTLALHGY